MRTFEASEIVIFEEICKKIYQKIPDLKNLTNHLLIRRSDLNYNTNQCSFTLPRYLA